MDKVFTDLWLVFSRRAVSEAFRDLYTLYRQASFRFLIGKQTTAVLQISSLYIYLTAMHKADRYNNHTFIIMALKLIWKKFNGLPKFSSFCVSDHFERCLKDRTLELVYSCCFGERYMQL